MLNINKEKWDHFHVRKYPELEIINWNKNEKVVLFMDQTERLSYLSIIKELMSKILSVDCITIKHYKSKNRILVFYKNNVILEEKEKEDYERFLEKIIENKFGFRFFIELVNFKAIYENRNFDINSLHKIVVDVIKNDKKTCLPVMPKSLRVRVNTELAKYSYIKYKTIGKFGNRRVYLYLKPDK